MLNMHKYAQICTICIDQNMQNMQNMHSLKYAKYAKEVLLQHILKNMLKYDEHPDGIPDPVGVFVIFSIFLKKMQN